MFSELDALREVRTKFPQAIPQVVAYGEVRCLQANETVAMLQIQSDGNWAVNWNLQNDPPVAVPPPSTPVAMEATEIETGEAVQAIAAEGKASGAKS